MKQLPRPSIFLSVQLVLTMLRLDGTYTALFFYPVVGMHPLLNYQIANVFSLMKKQYINCERFLLQNISGNGRFQYFAVSTWYKIPILADDRPA